jgi:transposase
VRSNAFGHGLGQGGHCRGVSAKSITRWENNYDEFWRVDPSSVLRGRPRILTSEMTEDLRQLISETPSVYPDEIAKWLTIYHNQPIFLGDNLRDLGLTYKLFRRVAAERDDVIAANLCRPAGLSRRI